MKYTYGIYIYQNVASLDFVGPYETFGISTHLLQEGQVVTIAETDKPIICSNGMEVVPQYTFDTSPPLDLLLVPGANSLDAALQSTAGIEWIKRNCTEGPVHDSGMYRRLGSSACWLTTE